MITQQSPGDPTTSAGTAPTTGVPAGGGMGAFGGIVKRRATLSLSDLRTPLVENILSMLPLGHDKAFKYALYNVVALILATVCVVAFWAAYCILEPFIVPLLWALLCGSVIHPFKDRLVTFAKEWLVMVKASSTPLAVQLITIPFRAVDSFSESIGSRVTTWWKFIAVGVGGFFLTYLIYYNPPVTFGLIIYWIVVTLINISLWLISWISGQFVFAVTAVYIAAVVHFVYGIGSIPLANNQEQVDQGSVTEPEKDMHNETTQAKATLPDTQKDNEKPASSSTKEAEDMKKSKQCLNRDKTITRTLSVITWILWFIYMCRLLPYPFLLLVIISLLTGTVVYVRKYSLRRQRHVFTPYTAIMTLIGGGGSRSVSRKCSLIQQRSRRNTQIKTPSPTTLTPSVVTLITQTPSPCQPIESKLEQHDLPTDAFGTPLYAVKRQRPTLDLKIAKECEEPSISTLHFNQKREDIPSNHEQHVDSEDEVDGILDSNKFLYGVFCACLIVQLWNRLWLVHLLPIPVVYYGMKRLCLSFGIQDYLQQKIYEPFRKFYLCTSESSPSRDLFPQPVRIFFNIVDEADRKIISVFESYLDMVASIIILVAVVVVSVIFLIFVATQFYAEGDHLVRVGANVINSTVSQYPEISQLLPEGWESLTGSLVGNAYHYGRDYIKTMIRDSVAEKDPAKAEEMEKQVIELWDRIYISWNRTWGSLDTVSDSRKPADDGGLEWDDFVKTGQNVTDWFDTSMMMNYAKANYGQLRAVLESVWTVLIGNVSLAISAITSIFSVLFGGGSALLNLIISFVVFFTALFYLLSASTSVYKPVEIFNSWFPGDGKHSSSFVAAIEESVSGVFSATLKMSAFYGMWTWLIHTLFQVNIVFVPSFFAAIFAAVPLLMPYWAAFPACLELWLIQGQRTKALLMLMAQMAPMSLVDAQIYSEIKGGGHPYLTALAVAGGIFYFGFQGAIMGPVVLCFLFVAVKVGSNYMKEGTL